MGPARKLHLAIGLLAVLVLLAPTAAAAAYDARLKDCKDVMCIVEAFLGGLVQIGSAIALGVAKLGNTIFVGFADSVLQPFFGLFGANGFFGGLGKSLNALGSSIFNGVGSAFAESYKQLQSYLKFFGPLAPVVATLVVLLVLGMIGWAIMKAFDRGNDPLPGPAEKIVDGDDDDEED